MHTIKQQQRMTSPLQRSKGFTLMEVLVAVMILSVGLLGLASLQSQGLRTAHQAYIHSQAIVNAYAMADRMRANRTGINNNQYYSFTGASQKKDPLTKDCQNTICSANEMATYDKEVWNNMILASMPSAHGEISSSAIAAGRTYTISIVWLESGSGKTRTFSFKVDL